MAEIAFEKLIIATGAAVKTLEIPGSTLPGIHYLRSLADSKRIRERTAAAKRAVVVGSGFIAMEVSSVLAQKGIETVMVVRDDRVFKKLFTPEMSHAFETYFAARGVRFIKQSEVKEARGEGRLTSVVLGDGRTLDCDLMVAGIGVQPLTRVAAESGIDVADGVVVNEYLETGVPGIYAAGDVANYQDTLFGKRRRVEHWDNAVSQGKHCGGALLGERHSIRPRTLLFLRCVRSFLRALGRYQRSRGSNRTRRYIEYQLQRLVAYRGAADSGVHHEPPR